MIVYVVQGGCFGDEHLIAIYHSRKKAEKRAEEENERTKGLEAYVEKWEIEK